MNAEATVLVTQDVNELVRVREPAVAAVVLQPEQQREWLAPLGKAVESGRLRVRRTVLPGVSETEVRRWLHQGVDVDNGLPDLKEALIADLMDLVTLTSTITGGECFVFRLFTEAPRRHCGYHVDTVAPGAPPWGLVRVYNGETTSYIDPAAVTSMADFYRYFGRRERLVRRAEAEADQVALEETICLDQSPPFVRDEHAVRTVPAGAVVAFTHVDAQEMFAPSATQSPWIHCSPMSGAVRLVVNISAARTPRRLPRGPQPSRSAAGRAD
jgi:hypothetical protein